MFLPNTEAAQRLIEYVSGGKSFSADTAANEFADKLGITQREAVKLAQSLGRAGFGKFVIGRRNHPTRLMWSPGHPNVGAIRKAIDGLNGASLEEAALVSMPSEAAPPSPEANLVLTIPQAKEALARSLGLSPENIEIIIRA